MNRITRSNFFKKAFRIYKWLDEKGHNANYDLSVADEFFVLYAVVTLYVSNTDWLKNSFRPIIQTIILTVLINVVMIIVALNQKKFWLRMTFYLLALVVSIIGTEIILEVSGHDLIGQRNELNSITLGMVIWIAIREISTFVMNLLPKNRSKD